MTRHAAVALVVLSAAGPALAQSAPAGSPGLSAGGLAPPSSMPAQPAAPPPSSQTAKELEEAEKEDSGRGLEWLWLDVEGGFQTVGLQTLHAGGAAGGLVPPSASRTSDSGPMLGVGAGLRLVFLTVGPRFRVAHFHDWDLWSLGAEVGLHLPLGNLEPYLLFGAGYSKLGNVADASASVASNAGVSVKGYDVRLGGGLDYYVTPTFSIGGRGTIEALALTRPGVSLQQAAGAANVSDCTSLPTTQQQEACATQKAYALDGSGTGMAATGSLVLGLHF